MKKGRRTWLEIDLDAIKTNVKIIREHLKPETAFCAIVKADAYGHGAKEISRMLDDDPGVQYFGVASYDEAVNIRLGGTMKPILILGYTDPTLAKECEYENFEVCCHSLEYAQRLSNEMRGEAHKLKVHIKIDTGMSRLGVLCQNEAEYKEALNEVIEILKLPHLQFEGIFTHFAESESEDSTFTDNQQKNFEFMVESLKALGHTFNRVHSCNSGGTVYHPEKHCTMTRAGTTMYGYSYNPNRPTAGLDRALQWKAIVAQVKWINEGASVSYTRTFIADKKMKIAVISVGYADGLFRSASGKMDILVNGKKARSIGRICMDQMMVDVTDIEDVVEGQIVTIYGVDNGTVMGPEEMSKIIDLPPIIMQTYISKRVPRVYFKNGKEVHETNYLT